MEYSAVSTEDIFVDLPDTDGLRIKGELRGSFDRPLVVLVHGRSGTGNSLLEYLGARYLYERGFTCLQLWMYDNRPDARSIKDCTIDTHVQDFDTVIEHLKNQGVEQILAAGHSYGGLTILKSQAQLQGAVLWDPSHGSYWDEAEDNAGFTPIPEHEVAIELEGKGYVLPLKMYESERQLGDTSSLAAGKSYPLEIISAGAGPLAHLHKKYIAAANEPKKHVVIEGAHHQFEDSDQIFLQVLSETADWLTNCLTQ